MDDAAALAALDALEQRASLDSPGRARERQKILAERAAAALSGVDVQVGDRWRIVTGDAVARQVDSGGWVVRVEGVRVFAGGVDMLVDSIREWVNPPISEPDPAGKVMRVRPFRMADGSVWPVPVNTRIVHPVEMLARDVIRHATGETVATPRLML